ncbi:hypothetical protein MHAS44199_22075 [Mycolicibacterium hassiacum DSM 44199]|nr:hypothetical protein [Mycolicibacterium hassiacum DSM 44199]
MAVADTRLTMLCFTEQVERPPQLSARHARQREPDLPMFLALA